MHLRFGCLAVFWAVLPALAGEGGSPGEWHQFHGPNRDNISLEKGLLRRWPREGPRLIWKRSECGAGYACVSVAEGRLYTSGDFGDEERAIALDLDGRVLWSSPSGRAWKGATPGARTTPTWSAGAVFHMNPAGRIAAFEAKTGKALWAMDLKEEFEAEYGAWAISENVVVDGKAVLCAPGGRKGRIVALDRTTGKTLWANRTAGERAAYCSPIVVEHDGVRQFITLMQRSVVSVDVMTGELLWSHPHRTPYDLNVTTPVFQGGRIFVTSGYGAGGRLLEIGPGSKGAKEVWSGGDMDSCHGGVLLIDGRLIGSGCRQSGKGFVCVDFQSGKTLWTDKGIGKVSLTFADGLYYCLGHEGRMMLIEADSKGPRIVSEFELPSKDRYDCLAHPVVSGGRLYIRQGKHLYAYDLRTPGAE